MSNISAIVKDLKLWVIGTSWLVFKHLKSNDKKTDGVNR